TPTAVGGNRKPRRINRKAKWRGEAGTYQGMSLRRPFFFLLEDSFSFFSFSFFSFSRSALLFCVISTGLAASVAGGFASAPAGCEEAGTLVAPGAVGTVVTGAP